MSGGGAPPPSLDDQWRDWLAKGKTDTEEDLNTTYNDFDKNVLAIASAALGLSIAFIKDIAHLGQAEWTWALFWSWRAFGLCILTIMVSYRFSMQALKTHRDWLYEVYEKRDNTIPKKTGFNTAVGVCTEIASGAFTCGLVLTLCFVIKNAEALQNDLGRQSAQTGQGGPIVINHNEATSVPPQKTGKRKTTDKTRCTKNDQRRYNP
jgi:hypothetical protein